MRFCPRWRALAALPVSECIDLWAGLPQCRDDVIGAAAAHHDQLDVSVDGRATQRSESTFDHPPPRCTPG
jgi:hypothetical protein